MDQLLANHLLVVSAVAWLLAQCSMLVISLLRGQRLRLAYLASAGGMPSSHAALVTALATRVGIDQGVSSPLFALAFVFAAIVMYDAAGVRRAVSVQARILNRMLEEVIEYQRFSEKRLRELLGHTPFEVFVGAMLGFATAITL
ncbi:MAG: divergent PAP2 family protein [Chloroflexi bacterium]|nr:divergent PAP2 family protein [Chloroflexota bacterium]